MKISRLHVERFGRDEFPTFSGNQVSGGDLLIVGGNRSGKTLTFNALLYGVYGPKATYNVSPGRTSEVRFSFDNNDRLVRGSAGRLYSHAGEDFETDGADEAVEEYIGEYSVVSHQFVPSEVDKLPLNELSQNELLSLIRRVVDSELEEEIEGLEEQRENLGEEIERVERIELKPREDELKNINISSHESRLDKIEQLQSLIDSGRIETIKQRLLDNKEIRNELEDLDSRRRNIKKELRKKERKLRERRRYTDRVNEIIIDAISELTCPVCDQIVQEDKAEQRLHNNRCPQCGRKRSLDDLKQDLRSKVESADDEIETLESDIEDLEEEKEEIENEIETYQESVPDLSELSDLAINTLKSNDYDIDAVEERTQQELDNHRSAIEELREKKNRLEAELEEVEKKLSELEDLHESTITRIQELEQEAFNNIISSFSES